MSSAGQFGGELRPEISPWCGVVWYCFYIGIGIEIGSNGGIVGVVTCGPALHKNNPNQKRYKSK